MEDILMPILIVLGIIIIYIPSQRLKSRERTQRMPRKTFWQLVIMYIIGAALIAAGFLVGGI